MSLSRYLRGSLLAGVAAALAAGCSGCASHGPPPIVAKAVPPRADAERAVAAFFAAVAIGPEAMPAFYRDYWSTRFPPPPDNPEIVAARAMQRRTLGALDARKITLATDRVRVDTCSAVDGWLTIDFFFEAAPPRRIIGVKAGPAPAPPESAPCAGDVTPHDDDGLRAAIDGYAIKRATIAEFSGVVLVARKGEPLFAHAYGEADRAHHVANGLDTRFNIGSSGKMFTAVSIAQLVERGTLHYEDLAAKWTDSSFHPRGFEAVTLSQVLSQTSGLGEVYRPPFFEIRDRLRGPKDYLDAFGDEPIDVAPGARWRYSNLGYMVLGRVIERASGETYEGYVQSHIFTPSGMTDITNARHDTPIARRAINYTHKTTKGYDAALHDAAYFDFPAGTALGCALATAEDMLHFATALLGGKLVTPATLATLTTGRAVMEGSGAILDGLYAYGFIEDRWAGVRHFGHGGSVPGANAFVEMLPDRDEVIIVLANTDAPAATWMGDRILAWMVGRP